MKRAAWAFGLLLLVAGCPEPGPAGKDASVRRDASRPDAEEVVIGDEDSGIPADSDGGTLPKADGGGVNTGIGWCNVQSPANGTIAVGAKLAVFGQVYVENETSQTGTRPDVEGQLGYGAQGSEGSLDNTWVWTNAAFNKDDGNNDEYKADLSPALGSWSYAYRFRFKNGLWQYCDLNGSANGYDKTQQGALTVTPVVPPKISWCKVVSAASATSKLGQNALVYGQVLATGVTDVGTGQGAGIIGEVGYGPLASDPTASKDWSWSAATFNKDVTANDEYEGRLAPASPGKYAFAYRFRLGTDEAVYCDTDSAGAGFNKDKLGTLEVTELAVDWCNLQFPPATSLTPGGDLTAYGQVLVKGTTDQIGVGADVEGELGVGAAGSNGSTDLTWTWTKAAFNQDVGSNDEYKATAKAGAVGAYAYAYRFRFKGSAWKYCDLDTSDNGYQQAQQGALSVATVKPKTIDWCNVQFPSAASVTKGDSTSIYGQVLVGGITEAAGAGADIVGEVGIGATTADASASDGAAFTWTAATFSKQDGNNDEFMGALAPGATGEYAYAFRFKYQGGAWAYCDLDGSANGFQPAQQGKLTVADVKPPKVDWCRLQWPPAGSVTQGTAYSVFGQVWVNGVTEAVGQGAQVEGQLGVGAAGSDGSTDAAWTWVAASYGKDVGNNDEYQADLAPAVGDYAYAFRFRYKGGPEWTYCDLDSNDNGFDQAQQGTLKVDPVPATTVDFCVLQWPPDGNVVAGTPFAIYGQVYKAGVTDPAGKAADIDGQYGYGAAGTDGSTDGTWTWKGATFNKDVNNNDEFVGELGPGEGNWAYAYRFRYQGGAWTYCDLDGSTNAYSKAQQGLLTVTAQNVPWVQLRPLASGVENAGSKLAVAAEVYFKGVTDAAGQGAGVTAQVGIAPEVAPPATPAWTWVPASYLGDAPGAATRNNDVYGATVTAPGAGSYVVTVRFTVAGKDYDADADGATAEFVPVTLQTFAEPAAAGNSVGWCNVQWPTACTAAPGATSCTEEAPGTGTTSLLFGRVYIAGVSDHVGSDGQIGAQWGIGPAGSSPRTDLWTWTKAEWNADADAFSPGDHKNDEYKAAFTAPAAKASYRYVFRFRLASGWTFCDTDGSNGLEGFDPAKSGTLTVQ
ncbi:MAG TPA: hypothetical protein VGK67_17505 [Myxococcales bacterium]